MKKSTLFILIGVIIFAALLIATIIGRQATEQRNTALDTQNRIDKGPAEKIEVVHFHPTKQCSSCIAVGRYALKTIQERFPVEYESGRMVFREVNLDLPENSELALKYQASGSSLFVNAIRQGVDDIEEDVAVWRLVYNESKYLDYFQEKLDDLLK